MLTTLLDKEKLLSLFNDRFDRFYVFQYPGRRRFIVLSGSGGKDRRTMIYARALVCVRENRILSNAEEVDHIDDNRYHDNIDNLQILTSFQNARKANRNKKITYTKVICAVCNTEFTRKLSKVTSNKRFHQQPVCSRSCAGKLGMLKMKEIVNNKQ